MTQLPGAQTQNSLLSRLSLFRALCESVLSYNEGIGSETSNCRSLTISQHPRVCDAFLLRVSVAVLLELTELAKLVEMPCLCCNTLKTSPISMLVESDTLSTQLLPQMPCLPSHNARLPRLRGATRQNMHMAERQ